MFSQDFKRFMAILMMVLAGVAVSQYLLAADDAGADRLREFRMERQDYPVNARDFVRAMNRNLNQEFDPARGNQGRLYDRLERHDYRESNFRNNLRGDFTRDYRDELRERREQERQERLDERRDVRLSEEARQLQERQALVDREYQSRRQDIIGRMGSHPIGSTEYTRYTNELRRLEERHLGRQQELNDRMRDLQMLESTSYSR